MNPAASNDIKRSHFGTDGVRGKVGQPPITADWVLRLGLAAGRVLASTGPLTHERPTVLIGKDTRVSGYMLESALEAGFCAAGVDVLLTGPLPTPAVAYLTRALRLQAGVVISASHNPYDDNGIKFFSANGKKLADEVEAAIEAAWVDPQAMSFTAASEHLGKVRRIEDAGGRYVEFCKSAFPNRLQLTGWRIVVDCAHGAAYHVAPQVFHELGAEVSRIGVAPDGFNINRAVGATAVEALQATVLAESADIGIALDGDGDRVILVDRRGRRVDGDLVLALLVDHRISLGLATPGVVGTVMTNQAVEHRLNQQGVSLHRAKVGDRYVLETMERFGLSLGGEGSGHLIHLDYHSTGDGIIAALLALAALIDRSLDLAEFVDNLPLYPQQLINVPTTVGFDWSSHPPLVAALAQIDERFGRGGRSGRVLIRPSGTEPLLRIMVEGKEMAEVTEVAQQLAAAARQR